MPTCVVFDLEFTSWRGALERDWGAPGRLREIVQIGALRLREDCSVVEEYEALVRPVVNPQLSDYFTELTGIDQETLDREGPPAAEALGDFLGFCRGQSVLSYGNDMVVLGENVGRLWRDLDLPKPAAGEEHSALFDCYSFASALEYLCEGGAGLPAFLPHSVSGVPE
ncbi:3'-5' exonuclease [Streptomyces prunicolor]|uniref:3'-5' exonuclease n=1 Tax=Streptomyces prunicolor TaxID=67348 RepID=UPI00047686E8|nr:3'-5' exonuclease [Streptomyces prunicolor]